jgi:hypothetical protein
MILALVTTTCSSELLLVCGQGLMNSEFCCF